MADCVVCGGEGKSLHLCPFDGKPCNCCADCTAQCEEARDDATD